MDRRSSSFNPADPGARRTTFELTIRKMKLAEPEFSSDATHRRVMGVSVDTLRQKDASRYAKGE
jgi:hypothetical protein